MDDGPESFPVRSRSLKISIQSEPADVFVSRYTDRVLVVISQLASFGTVLSTQREQVLGRGSTFKVDTLLGDRANPMPELCARQLAQSAADAGCDLPLLICLGLRPSAATLAGMRELLDAVTQHNIW